jgi:hypothetical protein
VPYISSQVSIPALDRQHLEMQPLPQRGVRRVPPQAREQNKYVDRRGAAPPDRAHHSQTLRFWCLGRRRLLGDIARIAAKTVTAAIGALTGERHRSAGIIACIQTHGSLANWHPRTFI